MFKIICFYKKNMQYFMVMPPLKLTSYCFIRSLPSLCTYLQAFSVKSIFQAEPAFPICQYDGSPGQNMIGTRGGDSKAKRDRASGKVEKSEQDGVELK